MSILLDFIIIGFLFFDLRVKIIMLGCGIMKKTNGFGLLGVIIIIVITAVVSSIATGVIMLNSTSEIVGNNIKDLTDDKELLEFIEVYNTLIPKYYDEIDKEGMLNAAEEGMLNFLGDKYTTYLEESEYNDIINELSGTYSGIGVTVENNKIISISKDSPAEKVGLEINDLIIKVNNIDVQNMNSSEIGEIIKNDTDNIISLVINRNSVELNFEVEKTNLLNPTISYKKIENTNIGYIGIENFSENLSDQVKEALVYLENNNINSLIIDIRNNVGGYLSSAEKTASLFLEEGKKIYSLSSNNSTYVYKDTTKEKRNYQIAVLINNNTASAAEILAAALKESYGATLIGTKSYGKGMVQQIVSLNSGDSVKYTTAKWLTPNDVCIDGIGLYPDYNVTYSLGVKYDSQMEKAIELLS